MAWAAAPLAAACLSLSPSAVIAAECKPIIVFYNGFFEQDRDQGLWRICNNYNAPEGATKKCRSWSRSHGGYETDFIKEHRDSTSLKTPIILIGYSYGGDTAYDVAESLPSSYAPTLITLDPVGKQGFTSYLPKPTRGDWINVYTDPPWLPNRSDLIARSGVRWKWQDNADRNREMEIHHDDIGKMFRRVAKPIIEEKLACLKE
ncbi:MAG: hypothetical protein OXF25_05825 [Cyanobacteria bacterium MAG CAR3_bin_5]|nr:hypothetical protein [Cyanobacteria bacterium MAG CAR3_bin_5]